MFEYLRELAENPHLMRLAALFLGCYTLAGVVRTILYIFDHSRAARRRLEDEKTTGT